MVVITDGVQVEVTGDNVLVKGGLGSIEKKFNPKILRVEKKDNEAIVSSNLKKTKRVRAVINAFEAHLKNMIQGVQKGFEKKLVCVFAHFPVSMEVKESEFVIRNFLGEKTLRKAQIVGSAKVEVKGNEIMVKGVNKEDVGQTAGNIIASTKVKEKDIRVFQDGIYHA